MRDIYFAYAALWSICVLNLGSTAGLVWASPPGYCDYNNDGYSDLAIGVVSEGIGSKAEAGAVAVLYGANLGLDDLGDQFQHRDVTGIVDTAEAGDHFGASLTSGDFNGDGYADLVVGVDLDDVSGFSNAGSI